MNHQHGTQTQVRQNDNGVEVTHQQVSTYSPYPPPELVRSFEEIEKGMANRLMTVVEKEQQMAHDATRHQMAEISKINDANIANQLKNSKLFSYGLLAGCFMGLLVIAVAICAIYANQPAVASAALVALGIILVILVLRKTPSKSETEST